MIGPGVGPSFYSGVPLPFPGATFGSNFTTSQYQLSGAVYGDPSLIPGWTFTRASTGYAETAAGALVAFASGAPRITDKGLLVEEARTNLLLRSQEFQTTWNRSNIAAFGAGSVADAITAPDGTLTADFICEDTAAGNHQVTQTGVTTTATATTYSVYAKAGTRSWLALGITDSASAVRISYFNIGTGALGTADTGCTTSIQALANGWYRCIVTVALALAGSNTARAYLSTGNGVTSYTGDGASGLYLWGAQLE